jgi:hypothetical protein
MYGNLENQIDHLYQDNPTDMVESNSESEMEIDSTTSESQDELEQDGISKFIG